MTEPQPTVQVPIPDDLDEDEREAYKAGFKACAELFGTAAATYASAVSDRPQDDEDDVDECGECGGELLDSMGADETMTPPGTVCPECEL